MAGETIITQWLNAVNSDEKRISSIIELQDGGGHFMTLSNIISSKKLERLPGRMFSQLVDERYTFIMSTLTETYNFNMTELINPALCKEGIELELEKVALLLLCALVQTIILTENHAELLIPLYGLDAELHQTIIDAISSIIEGGNDICALTIALEHTLSSIHEKEAPVSVSQKKQPKKRRSTQRESQLRVFLESSGLYKQVHNKVVDILKNKVCKLENEKTVDISQSSSSSSSMLSFGTKELTACANDTEKVQLLEEKYKDLERRYLEQKEDLHKTKGKLDVKIIELKAAENNSQFQHNLLQRQQAEFKAQKDKDETSSTSSLLKQNKEIEQQMKRIKGLEDKTKELTTLKKTQIAELADMKRANRKLQRELDTITERYGSVIQKSEDYEKDREQLESNCNCFKLKVEELTQQLQEFSQNRDDHSEPMIGQVEEIKGHERLKESSHGGESAISKIERDTESIAVKLENESALSPLRQDLELQLVSCKEQITNRNMQLVEHQGRIKEYELRVTQYEEEQKNCDEKVLMCEETVKSNDKQFKNKVKELKVQISECQKQLTECQKQVADCQKQISGDQLQIVQYQETIKSNELQFENKVKELDFQIAEHKERISEDERQIVQYQETIKSNELQFENKVKELDFQIAECKERISEDERQIVQYQETIKSNDLQFENKVKELDFQTAKYKERISEDERQIVQYQENIKSNELLFENKVKELDVQIAECQKQISGDERQIVQYEETIKSNELQFENKVKELDFQIAEHKERISEGEREIVQYQENIKSNELQFQNKIKELDVQISDYKGQIVLFQEIIKSNESLEVEHKAKIAEASSEMARCTEEVQNGKLRIAECERENRNLQSSLSQNQEEMREVKSKIIEYEVKVQEQQSQINRYIESEKDLTFKLSQCEESEKTQGLLIAELKKTKTNLQLELSEKLTELQKTAELLSELEMKSQTLSMKPTHVAHERYSVELKKKDEEIAKLENLVKEKIKLLKSEKKSYNECKRELEYTGELLKNEKSMHEQKLSGLTAEKNAAFEALKMEYTHKLENREQLLKKEIKKQMRDKDTVAVKEENRWLQGENKKKENTITKLQTEMDDRTNIFQEQMMTVEQMKNKKIGQLLTDKETLEKKMTELQKTCEQETANYNSNFEKLRNEISEKAAAIDGMQTTLKLKEELLSASHQERDALLQKIQACSHIEEISKAKLKELEAKFAERTNIFQEQMMSVEQAKNEKINQLLAEKEIVQKECTELREEYNSNLEKLRSEISEKASVIDNMQATIKMKDEDLNASHQERDSLLEKLRSEISEKASVIDNLQATLKIKDADLNASHQERDSLLEKLRSEISEKTSVIDNMQATMKMKDEDLNASHQERDSLLKNVQECRRIEEMSTAKLKELDAKFVERTNILQEQIMLIEQAKNETISQLRTDKEKLQEEYNNDLEKLRSEISEKASVIDNLQATLTIKDADLNASHQEHDSLLEKLRSEISEKTSTIDNMKVTDKSKDDKLSASYQERDALLKKIKECGRIEEANRKLLDNSYLANEALIQKLSDVQEQNKELTASLENLRVQKEKLTRKVSNMQIQNLGLSFRIDGFQNTEVSSSQQHPSPEKEASEQNEENSTKLTSARLDVQTLSKQVEALGEKKVQAEKLNTDLKEKMKELENQLEEASKLNNENVMKLGSAQLEVESLSKQMEALGETKMQAENLNADLKEKIKELESQLEEASELNDENVMKLGSAQLEVESLSKQIEALGETKMHAENLNADLKKKIKELESQLEEASKLNDENVMKLGSAQLEVESLSKQIEALGETKMHAESLNADLKEKIKELESQLEIKTENLKEQIAVTETAAEESSKKLHQEQLCEPDAMIGKRQTEGSISCDDEQDLSPEEELEVTCEIFILTEDFLVEIRNEKESVLGAVEAFKTVLVADHQRELIQKLEASVEAANERLRERIENICAEKNQEMNDLQAEKDVKIKTLTEDLELSEELKLKLFDKVQRIHQFVGEDHEAEDEKLRNALVRRERDVKMMTAKIKALKSELSQKTKIADDFNEVVRRYREERKKIKRLFGDNDALREKLTFLEEIYTDTKIVGKMMGDVKRLTDERDREHNSFEYWKQRAYTSEYLMGQYQDDLSRHKRMIRMTRIKLTLLSDHPDAEEYLKIQTDRRKRARDPENDLKDDEYFPLVAADDDFSFLEEYPPDYSHNCTQTMPVAIKKIADISVPGPSGIEEQPKEKVLFGKTPAMRFRKAKIEKEQDLERRKKLPAGHPERYVPKQKRKKPLPKRYVAALDIPTSSSEEVECSGCISPVRKRRKVFDWVTGC